MTEKQATPPQDAPTVMQPYEAGFSTNFMMIHPVAGRQQFTFRGAFASDWHFAMEEASAFVKEMRAKGWKLEGEAVSQSPAQNSVQSANTPKTPPTRPQEGSGATQTPQGVQSIIVKKLEITPKADGKAEMKFYADGHKYPDLYSTLPVANCIAVLSDVGEWTNEYFSAAGSYDVEFLAEYKLSEKLNSRGNPYKDLVKVRPVEY